MKKLFMVLAIISLLVLAAGCPAGDSPSSKETDSDGAGNIPVGIEIGNRAPDFQLQTRDGQTVSLSSLRGQPVLLNFWATWCGPCRAEMPYLEQAWQAHKQDGLVLLAVNLRESSSEVSQFVQYYGYTFSVLLDSGGVADSYGIQYIPTTYFIDSSGIIRDVAVGSFPSRSALEQRLSQLLP